MTAAPPDNDVLSARALVKSYNGSPALRGVSLSVREGEILAVTGPRGCGKSTLLNCLSGHLLPDEGEVWFGNVPVHTLPVAEREKLHRERFGWIGPEPELVPELTVCENAALPLLLGGTSPSAAKSAAQEWLERLDVADCARRRPAELLQAQRQRVSIARALVSRPAVLFADEPTAPLHRNDQAQILRTLAAVCRSHGITIVLATNDAEVAVYADRSVAMVDGCREVCDPVLSTVPPDVVAAPLQAPPLPATIPPVPPVPPSMPAAAPPTAAPAAGAPANGTAAKAPAANGAAANGTPKGTPTKGTPTKGAPVAAASTPQAAAPASAAQGPAGTAAPGGSAPTSPPGSAEQGPTAAPGQTTSGTAVAVSGLEGADRCSASA